MDNNFIVYEMELVRHGLSKNEDGSYDLIVGDRHIVCDDIQGSIQCISQALKELKSICQESWLRLGHLAEIIRENSYQTKSDDTSLSNILFLNTVRSAKLLSTRFQELKDVSASIDLLMHLDIEHIDNSYICEFNELYMDIFSCHSLILNEQYRLMILKKLLNTPTHIASGPFLAGVDLPYQERVIDWDDEEESEMQGRNRQIRLQTRYNPEMAGGAYFTWVDHKRWPYLFKDREEEGMPSSPYGSIP